MGRGSGQRHYHGVTPGNGLSAGDWVRLRVQKKENFMRKQLTIALLAATVAAACSKGTEHIAGREAIEFRSEVASRAIVEDEEGMREGGIGVFGAVVCRGGTSTETIFDNEHLTYTAGRGWHYAEPSRYWISGAKYVFTGIYPYAAEAYYAFDAQTGVLTVADYESGGERMDEDLMYAVHARDLAQTTNREAVPLAMHHACAAVEFRIINGSGSTVTAIEDIALTGLQHNGTLAVQSDGTATWTLADERVAENDTATFGGTFAMPEGGFEDDIRNPLPLYDKGTITVLPQVLRGQAVKLTFRINGTTTARTANLSNTTDKWEAGKRYVYTMALTNDTIAFDVTVIEWIEDEIDLN